MIVEDSREEVRGYSFRGRSMFVVPCERCANSVDLTRWCLFAWLGPPVPNELRIEIAKVSFAVFDERLL